MRDLKLSGRCEICTGGRSSMNDMWVLLGRCESSCKGSVTVVEHG